MAQIQNELVISVKEKKKKKKIFQFPLNIFAQK